MLSYNTSTEAWEELNKEFLLGCKKWDPTIKSGCIYVYDLVVHINTPKLDPEFDFGSHFNYSYAKWKSLVGNYIDKDNLENTKEQVLSEEKKGKNRVYNIALQFNNKHKHGKNCLLSIIFSRRAGKLTPTLCINLRASEVTKRLACDLLLFQRIGEFVYGSTSFDMVIHFNQIFNDDNVLLMYHAHEDVLKFLKLHKKEIDKERYSYLRDQLKKLLETDPMDIKYKIYRRIARSIQPDFKNPKTLAKDCTL